jgi:dTDP-4-amino-4,6-dideoxygalactose transaminase
MKVPFLSFQHTNQLIKSEVLTAFENFFNDGSYILGKGVENFETEYAEFSNTNFCVGVSNGLDALHLALKTLGVGPGHEVIVPSNTFIATVMAVSYVGASPVFVEPDRNTYNINPSLIEEKISSKTKAIIPVHLYGQACEMGAITKIAEKNNLFIVEDNAQAQGSSYDGRLTGSWGHINATSFYPGKNLGALGDAGALTTNDENLAGNAKILRNYGSDQKYYNEVIGYNMRLDECQAIFLNIKLKHLDSWNNQRRAIAKHYNDSLKDVGDLILPGTCAKADHVYHLYVILSDKRNELQEYLLKKGIGTLIHYPVPPHLQKAYAGLGFKKGMLPVAEEISNKALSLPVYPGLTNSEIEYISGTIKQFFNA